MKKNLEINDLVLSSNFGLGKIIGFEEMGQPAQDFVVIESLEKKVKMMAPMSANLSFRKLSDSDTLVKKLNDLKDADGSKDFDSKKDRITYFKSRSMKQDLDSILETVAQLRDIADRGSVENKIYENLLDNIQLEIQIVLEIEAEPAGEMVQDCVKCA